MTTALENLESLFVEHGCLLNASQLEAVLTGVDRSALTATQRAMIELSEQQLRNQSELQQVKEHITRHRSNRELYMLLAMILIFSACLGAYLFNGSDTNLATLLPIVVTSFVAKFGGTSMEFAKSRMSAKRGAS